MPDTVTDILETIFQAPDIGSLIDGFGRAAQAAITYSGAQTQATTATTASTAAIVANTTALKDQLILLGQIGLIAGAIGGSLNQFARDQEDIFRAAVILRNRGMAPMIKTLQEFAAQLQQTTAVDDEAVVGLGALLAQFGVAANQIIPAIRAIVDANQAGKGSFDQLALAFGKALLPGGRGAFALRRLGIDFKATGDRIKDTNTLIEKFNQLFGGAAEARLDTPLGLFDQLKEAMANLASSFGHLFNPFIVAVLQEATQWANALTSAIELLIRFLNFQFPGLFPEINPAAGVGKPGSTAIRDDESLGYQKQTAENTKHMLDAIVKQVIGGTGTIAREAATTLALRRALGG